MKSLRRMTRYLRPYKWIVALGLLTTILPVTMELVVPRALQFVIDKGIRASDVGAIGQGALVMFGAAVVGALATLGQGVCRAQLSQGMAFDMRNELFAHIQSFSLANLDQMRTGQLMTRVSSDVDTVRMFSSAGLALLLRALLMIIGSVVMLVITDWRLSLVVFALLAVAGVILRTLMRTAQPLFAVVQQKLAALNTVVQENLAGVRVVKAYVRERFEIGRFAVGNVDYRDQNIRVGRIMALALPLLALLTNMGTVGILWWGGMDAISGRLSVGELVAFINYLMIGMAPLLLLSNMLMMVSRAEASATRVLEVLDTPPRIQAIATPYRPTDTQRATRGRIVFENVSFRYGGASANLNGAYTNGKVQTLANTAAIPDKPPYDVSTNGHASHLVIGDLGTGSEDVLDAISFAAEPGQRIALLGATGSGKTTLINLIPRFYDATAGRILVDGIDVREWAPDALRKQIGMVMQRTTLFSGTVRENIAYGQPDAPMEAVMAVAQAAQAHDFITRMPDGYDSHIEARGTNLSGGQRQRIAIARALLIAPTILILDDSTSAIDFETEVRIQDALDEIMAHCTTFIVAQRINSVLKADQIFVLDRGRIAARGTHRELLGSSAIYREIYESQLGEA